MMNKVLITGGSGFIGTNLIEKLLQYDDITLLNIDIAEPKIERHRKVWHNVDVRNGERLKEVIMDFQPDYVIHLAARTDLNGKELQDYDANMQGVSNMLDVLEQVPNLKQAVFASSMYVCEPGYMPKDFEDYAPHTLYGESKVETERRIKERDSKYTWSIIRPTSIWDHGLGNPTINFSILF